MRGQGYDGTSNMSGKYRGVRARVKELYPLAMYTHCCNHVLNLVISTSSQLPAIRNAMATISDICVFLSRSAQRLSIFQDNAERSFRLGFFATEAETNLRHMLGRKKWLDHHFHDTIASSCFYTWGIVAGKQASGRCDQSSNLAQFCTEMHVLNRGFSYATHFWYNPACFKTAVKEGIGYTGCFTIVETKRQLLKPLSMTLFIFLFPDCHREIVNLSIY